MALRTEVLIPAGPQHHQKQAAPFDLHAFQYYFSGIWNQRRLFHRTHPEIARATLLLPPNTSSAKCPLWFTKCADEPRRRPKSNCEKEPLCLILRPQLQTVRLDRCFRVHLAKPNSSHCSSCSQRLR